MGNIKGFTLLETMIAVAIMAVAFAAILMVENSSLSALERSRKMNTVAMLARNAMVQAEMEFEGKPFSELKEEESGKFDPPYESFIWEREIKEIEFPEISFGGGGEEDSGTSTQMMDRMVRLLSQYFSQSIREVKIKVSWPKGKGVQSYELSTYWVDLNKGFSLNEGP